MTAECSIEPPGVGAVAEHDEEMRLKIGIERLLRHKYYDLVLLCTVAATFCILLILSASPA